MLYVGRLEREKGLDVLLRAWQEAEMNAGARLAIAGAGPLAGAVARAPGAVRGLGHVGRGELPALYAAADLLVLPSVRTATFVEPWGLVLNEAMLQGTPVVSSDAVGAAAGGLVRNGTTGFVVAAGDSRALATRLKALEARSRAAIERWPRRQGRGAGTDSRGMGRRDVPCPRACRGGTVVRELIACGPAAGD